MEEVAAAALQTLEALGRAQRGDGAETGMGNGVSTWRAMATFEAPARADNRASLSGIDASTKT